MRPELPLDAYRPADRATLYDICLRTGRIGADASADHEDPELLGHIYVGPYLELEPELAFVLRDGGDQPVGYAVATADTAAFEAACERRWWPALRARYSAQQPSGPDDATFVELVRSGVRTSATWLDQYPAHLHINLLPPARGSGGGRALITRIVEQLQERGVPGVHLGASSANTGAVEFYRRLGFTVLDERRDTIFMGRLLEATS